MWVGSANAQSNRQTLNMGIPVRSRKMTEEILQTGGASMSVAANP